MSSDDAALEALFDAYVERLIVHDERLDLRRLCSATPHLLAPLEQKVQQLDEVRGLLASRRRPRIGGTLGRFRIEEQIGRGATSVVYRAFDSERGDQVALKLFPPELIDDDEIHERFRREANLLAELEHPNIVRFHSIELVDGFHFLVTELLTGPTLAQLVDPTGLDASELMAVAEPIAAALDAAHQRSVAHRDLKPTNGMYAADGTLKLLDFGLARASRQSIESLTLTGSLVGTVPYMAPEQLLGGAGDALSDVYAYGVLLYELARGRRPFRAQGLVKMVRAVFEQEPEPLGVIRGDQQGLLAAIIGNCLHRDRAKRPQGMAEIRAALDRTGLANRLPERILRTHVQQSS